MAKVEYDKLSTEFLKSLLPGFDEMAKQVGKPDFVANMMGKKEAVLELLKERGDEESKTGAQR